MHAPPFPKLRALARAYGIQTSYVDMNRRPVPAPADTLLSILAALGAQVEREQDAPEALRARRAELLSRPLEPVEVAWNGIARGLRITLPARRAEAPVRAALELGAGPHSGESLDVSVGDARPARSADGTILYERALRLPARLPAGYHRLQAVIGEETHECLLLSAPARAYHPGGEDKSWGVFMPLFALHSGRGWSTGTFSDLEELLRWTGEQGGAAVGSLPLMASFLDEPFDPSPYATASRLFLNELYIDIGAVPELHRSPEARALLNGSGGAISDLRSGEIVDYRGEISLRRKILEAMVGSLDSEPSARLDAFRTHVASHDLLRRYAAFRAAGERFGGSWRTWPAGQRDGTITEADYDRGAYLYHLYVQWVAAEQLRAAVSQPTVPNTGLYMDFPVGVHASSFDVWNNRRIFIDGVTAGAPPDPYFTSGQDWGFPPLHPGRIREAGYRYVIESLRSVFRFARIARIDHLMGFHRLFWTPAGKTAERGTYVAYRASEFYAIVNIESHRFRTAVVGEDLGIVPAGIRREMLRRGLSRMYILQFEAEPDQARPLRPPPARSVASLNTHDTPTFAGFWKGADIQDRVRYGFLRPEAAGWEKDRRGAVEWALVRFLRAPLDGTDEERLKAVLQACLGYLSRSDAWLVVVNLEDLWLEARPHNIPGTFLEHPNWRRKAAFPLEEITRMQSVREALSGVASGRTKGE